VLHSPIVTHDKDQNLPSHNTGTIKSTLTIKELAGQLGIDEEEAKQLVLSDHIVATDFFKGFANEMELSTVTMVNKICKDKGLYSPRSIFRHYDVIDVIFLMLQLLCWFSSSGYELGNFLRHHQAVQRTSESSQH
jgi:hypothetical protein